jgi:hypothetical protein
VVSVDEYETVPVRSVDPCLTINVVALIELGSIGVLKVALIALSAAILAKPVAPLALNKFSFVPPLTGDVRITVGAMVTLQGVTIPGSSSLQPLIKTMNSKATVSVAEIGTLKNPRIVRERYAHRLRAVFIFVVKVFMNSSFN